MISAFKNLKIRHKIVFLLGVYSLSIVLVVAFVLTQQFNQSLKERIFLQLSSIRTLKEKQVERLLATHLDEIEMLLNNIGNDDYLDALADDKLIHIDSIVVGGTRKAPFPYNRDSVWITDISAQQNDGKVHLAYTVPEDELYYIFYLTPNRLQDILFERTGMGNTGESYIVGDDSYLRTISRFLPDSMPTTIYGHTKAVLNARKKGEGILICNDYRGIEVLSSHGIFNYHGLEWIILSEIDEQEAMLPLAEMHKRVFIITLIIMLVVLVASYAITSVVVNPILKISQIITRIAKGERTQPVQKNSNDEIGALYATLNDFMGVVNRIITFADHISHGQFGDDMPQRGKNDDLVIALNNMKNQLIELKANERLLLLKSQRQLMAGEEKERARLARELHDSIGPLLTNLKLSVQQKQVEGAEDIKRQILHIIDEVRKISFNLMPSVLRDFGLIEAVRNYLQLQFKHTSTKISFMDSREGEANISMELSLNIYRIIQEAVHNIIKYAQASEVKLSITEFENQIHIFISDNGTGFDPQTIKKGNGLLNMQERARMFNGHFELQSDNSGTTIEVEFTTT